MRPSAVGRGPCDAHTRIRLRRGARSHARHLPQPRGKPLRGVGQGAILARAQVVVASVVQRDVEQLHAFDVREFALDAPLSRHTHAVAFEVESVSAARI